MTDTDLKQRIRDAGLRATAPRIAVLEVLLGASGPLSHAEVVDVLDGVSADRATVYRNLVAMSDAGLLVRRSLGDRVWRFEIKGATHAHGPGKHPHFVCTSCGEVECLPGDVLPAVSATGAPRSVQRGNVEVELRGVCDDCSEG